MASIQTSKGLTIHTDFQQTNDADVLVQSSDGVQFYLHVKNLSTNTGAFPANDIIGSSTDLNDIVHLPESSVVLAILFGFIYPRKHPSLKKLGYDVMGPVAEAVEKYEVYSAMFACESRLRELAPDYPAQILAHGIKHDYSDLIDATTPYYSRKSLAEVATVLPPNLLAAWCRYREAWDICFRDILKHVAEKTSIVAYGGKVPYFSLDEVQQVLRWQTINNLDSLRNALGDYPDPVRPRCQNCTAEVMKTRFAPKVAELANMLLQAINKIPPFTSFL